MDLRFMTGGRYIQVKLIRAINFALGNSYNRNHHIFRIMTERCQEVILEKSDFIVSKTDTKGKITYGNRVFIKISGYDESELIGQPHRIIRHPDMPRAVFQMLWKTLQAGNEFFGLIKNRTKQGGYYWTLANVTPSYDAQGRLLGYYSVRRYPSRTGVQYMTDLYRKMLELESGYSNALESMEASGALLEREIEKSGKSYEEFLLSIAK